MENEVADRQERSRALRFLDNAATAAEGSKEQQYIERKIRELIDNTKQSVEDQRFVTFPLFSLPLRISLTLFPFYHLLTEKNPKNLKQINAISNLK